MSSFTKFFSYFNQVINIFFFSWLPQALTFLMLVFLVSLNSYKRKLLGFAAINPLDCAICLCDFEKGDKGRKVESCNHIFHENCLDKWLMHGKGQATCPLRWNVIIPEKMVDVHRKVEDEGVTFGTFEEELALLLFSWLTNGSSSRRCF
ncbi:unnamed protein product [Withania somnifera]